MNKCICRICGSEKTTQIYDQVSQAPESSVYICQACGINFIHPIMSQQEEDDFYAESFENYMAQRSGPSWESPEEHFFSQQSEGERRLNLVRKYLKRSHSVLEIGSSTGYFLDDLRGYTAGITGIEPSRLFREYANSMDIRTVSKIEELTGQKYDIILMYYVVEHLRDPVGYFRDLKCMLTGGGKILVEVPNVDDALITLYNAKGFQSFYWQKAHYYNYSHHSLEYVLKKAGYQVSTHPEQRYDLSNHMNWLQNGVPGGTGLYSEYFGKEVEVSYAETLKQNWICDTIFAEATSADGSHDNSG